MKELHPKYSPFDCDRLHKGEPIGVEAVLQLSLIHIFLTSIVYLCTVVWFGFCIFGGFLVDRTDYETSVTTGKYLMIGFAVFFVLHFAFMKCFAALNKRETYTMAHIIYLLFPGARYNPCLLYTSKSSKSFSKPELT